MRNAPFLAREPSKGGPVSQRVQGMQICYFLRFFSCPASRMKASHLTDRQSFGGDIHIWNPRGILFRVWRSVGGKPGGVWQPQENPREKRLERGFSSICVWICTSPKFIQIREHTKQALRRTGKAWKTEFCVGRKHCPQKAKRNYPNRYDCLLRQTTRNPHPKRPKQSKQHNSYYVQNIIKNYLIVN